MVLCLVLLFVCGCAPTAWRLESINSGDAAFNAARLLYQDSSPLRLELIRSGEEISSFLSLTQFWFQPPIVKARFLLGETALEESLPVLEGSMRLRMPPKLTEQLIAALREGKKVSILVDGFEETLFPDQFSKLYEKFTGKTVFFQNPFKEMQ